MKFTKKDFWFSIFTGLTTGVIGYLVFWYLGKDSLFGVPTLYLIAIVPICWILGVNLGYILGRWIGFFNQFGKFAAIGFTNFAVDSGVLYLLIYNFGTPDGWLYTVFKGCSFFVAMIHSYIWNKYWVFGASQSNAGASEFIKFLTVTLSSLVVNVGVATFVYKFFPPVGNIAGSMDAWAGISGIIGSATALIFSFAGFRIAVFKKEINMNKIIFATVVLIVIGVGVAAYFDAGNNTPILSPDLSFSPSPSISGSPSASVTPGKYDSFAQCLTDKKATMYGAYWCSHCQAQKKLFESSWQYVTYVECTKETKRCEETKITGYPTWVFADGSRLDGEVPLKKLSEKTGCAIE